MSKTNEVLFGDYAIRHESDGRDMKYKVFRYYGEDTDSEFVCERTGAVYVTEFTSLIKAMRFCEDKEDT